MKHQEPAIGGEFLPQIHTNQISGPPDCGILSIGSLSTSYSQWSPLSSYNQSTYPSISQIEGYDNTIVNYGNGFTSGQTLLPINPNANDIFMQSQQLPAFHGNDNGHGNTNTVPTAPLPKRRKRKAPTLRQDDWEPVKARVIELHIAKKLSLREVKQTVETEFTGFTATIRQYRTRVSQWGLDKKVKSEEMKAIVRKRQQRKLIETHKGPLIYTIRGSVVASEKIDRWMKRNNVSKDMVYAPSSAAATPEALSAWTISERGSPAPSPTLSRGDWEMSPMAFLAHDVALNKLEAPREISCLLPWWATTDGCTLRELPWLQFHSLFFIFQNAASPNNITRDTLKDQVPDQSICETNTPVINNLESMDIIDTIRKQGGVNFNLEEVMPECFRVDISLDSQIYSTLSKRSSTIQLAEIGLFLASNSLLNGSNLVILVEKTLKKEGDMFFRQLFKLQSSTVRSFSCRLLESLTECWYDTSGLLRRLLHCGLDHTIIAGPTGGRCLQLAISSKKTSLALFLINNGVQRNPKLGSKEPFNKTPIELAKSRKEWAVYESLLGRPRPVQQKPMRTKEEVALENAIKANDIEQIHSLLGGGLDIDIARNSLDELILEWTFFEIRACYDVILPYSRVSDRSWTVPGIISAAITSEKLSVYLCTRTGKENSETLDDDDDDIELCDILDRSIELAMANDMIDEVHNILDLGWIQSYLDIGNCLLQAANTWNLDIMVKLVAHGADVMILHENGSKLNSDMIDECLTDVLSNGETGNLQKLLKIGWFSPEDLFAHSLDLTWTPIGSLNPLEKVQMLIHHGLDLSSAVWPKESDSSYTPLQLATHYGDLEIVKCLIDAGADINHTSDYSSYTTLGEAVHEMNPEIVRFLVQRGANLKEFGDDQETTLIELAVGYSDIEEYGLEILEILLESGADVNGPNYRTLGASWNTALTRAILTSREQEVINLLLEYGADIHQLGGSKGARTPLQAAAEKGEIKIGKELLERGACVNAQAGPDHGRTALQAACEGGQRSAEMISLLLERGAEISAPPAPKYGRTALQALCCSENPSSELMTILIDRGADINAPAADVGGLTALQGAALMGNIKISMLLLDKGADVNAPPSRQEGRMALDGAAEYGRLDTVQLLLAFGATCMVPGASGYDSAIDFAEDNGFFEIADILRSHNRQPEGELFDMDMCW